MAIYLTKQPPAKRLNSLQVPPMFGFAIGIDIPAAEKRYTVKDSFVLAGRRRSVRRARTRALSRARDEDDGDAAGRNDEWTALDQRLGFRLAGLVLLQDAVHDASKGTRIDSEIVYDNSDANPRNPNSPPTRVKWGLGTLDEMGSMTLLVSTSSRADDAELRRAATQHFRQQLATMFLAPK